MPHPQGTPGSVRRGDKARPGMPEARNREGAISPYRDRAKSEPRMQRRKKRNYQKQPSEGNATDGAQAGEAGGPGEPGAGAGDTAQDQWLRTPPKMQVFVNMPSTGPPPPYSGNRTQGELNKTRRPRSAIASTRVAAILAGMSTCCSHRSEGRQWLSLGNATLAQPNRVFFSLVGSGGYFVWLIDDLFLIPASPRRLLSRTNVCFALQCRPWTWTAPMVASRRLASRPATTTRAAPRSSG